MEPIKEKTFVARESHLTELFAKDEHVCSARNLAVATVIMAALDATFRGSGGLRLLLQGFSGLGQAACIWAGMFSAALALRVAFSVWQRAPGRSNALWTAPLALFYCAFLWLPAHQVAVADWTLGICSRIVVLTEQVCDVQR